MNINIQRKTDRFVGTLLCRLFSLLPSHHSGSRPPRNILVILLSEMGSLVLAKPMFRRIKNKYPGAHVHMLVFKRNAEFVELLDLAPSKRIYTIRDNGLMNMATDSFRALSTIRKNKMDVVIDCELFARISSLYSFFSRAGVRVGFHRHTMEGLYKGDFINRPVLYNPYLHISEQFINLVEAIEGRGAPVVKRLVNEPSSPGPVLFNLDERDIQKMLKRVSTDFPKINPTRLILLYPGGGLLPIRAWPIENYGWIAQCLNNEGYPVGVIGLKNDHLLAEKIIGYGQPDMCVDLTGYTLNIRELMSLFHHARLLITNDGGPGHFAAMTPIRSIILYGPETPLLYGPLSERSFSFYNQMACSPCLTAYNHRATPCDGNNVCLQSISPEAVLKKAYEFLEEKNDEEKDE